MAEVIAFYRLVETQDKTGWIGAILVTDDMGKPEEFRVTYPVKPTTIQRRLYGDSLLPHIGLELAGKPLYKALNSKPKALVVNDVALLELYKTTDCPVVMLKPFATELRVGGEEVSFSSSKISSESGRFVPINCTYPSEYSMEERTDVNTTINKFFAHFDLVEPFQRIEIALKTLAEQDNRFR